MKTTHRPIGPKVVPFVGGSYLELHKVIPKRNYFGAYGYSCLKKQAAKSSILQPLKTPARLHQQRIEAASGAGTDRDHPRT